MQRDKRLLTKQLRSLARFVNRMRANVFLSEYDVAKGRLLVDELRKLAESDKN
jgi:predicted nucleotidyltransferase